MLYTAAMVSSCLIERKYAASTATFSATQRASGRAVFEVLYSRTIVRPGISIMYKPKTRVASFRLE